MDAPNTPTHEAFWEMLATYSHALASIRALKAAIAATTDEATRQELERVLAAMDALRLKLDHSPSHNGCNIYPELQSLYRASTRG